MNPAPPAIRTFLPANSICDRNHNNAFNLKGLRAAIVLRRRVRQLTSTPNVDSRTCPQDCHYRPKAGRAAARACRGRAGPDQQFLLRPELPALLGRPAADLRAEDGGPARSL